MVGRHGGRPREFSPMPGRTPMRRNRAAKPPDRRRRGKSSCSRSAVDDLVCLLAGRFLPSVRRHDPGSSAISRRCRLCNPPVAGYKGRGTGTLTGPEQAPNRRLSGRIRQEQAVDTKARDRAPRGCNGAGPAPRPDGLDAGAASRAYRGSKAVSARSRTSSPRPLMTARSTQRLKPLTSSALIVGGMDSSCFAVTTSSTAGPS